MNHSSNTSNSILSSNNIQQESSVSDISSHNNIQSSDSLSTNISKTWQSVQSGIFSFLLQVFNIFFFVSKIFFAPVSYPLYWAWSLSLQMCKLVKILCTFFLDGVHGVLASFRKGCFGQKIHYAVLKQSGLYLKNLGISLEDAFTYQLYDYSIRKFMSISHIQQDLKVGQIQPWSHIGMQYLKDVQRLDKLTLFHNNIEKAQKIKSKIEQIDIVSTNYSSESFKNPQDIFIMFNRSKDLDPYNKYVDIIKILSYVRRNLNENGYFVIGNTFNSDGEITVFEELVNSFGFTIEQKQDISSNILHSKKILKKVYKKRLFAWLKEKIREAITKIIYGDHKIGRLFKKLWTSIENMTGIKYTSSQYIVYILDVKI